MDYLIPVSDNEQRAKNLVLAFRIYICLLILGATAEIFLAVEFTSLDSIIFSPFGRIFIIGFGLLSLVRIVGYILLGIFFIMWMRRAYHNLHKAGARHLRHSEGWASGAWFVPFVNLAWPFQIMRDIWEEMQVVFRKQGEKYEREYDNLIGWWWAVLLASGMVSYIGSIMLQTKTLVAGYSFTALGTIGYIFDGALALLMIKKISKMEDEMFQRAQVYYAWVSEQYAQQYQQTQNQNSNSEYQAQNISEQQNFYKPGSSEPPTIS